MFKLFYNIRNRLLYRKPRKITRKTCDYIRAIKDPRIAFTELLLMPVGLRVVEKPNLDGIYLTDIQRSAKNQAELKGFNVGLR